MGADTEQNSELLSAELFLRDLMRSVEALLLRERERSSYRSDFSKNILFLARLSINYLKGKCMLK